MKVVVEVRNNSEIRVDKKTLFENKKRLPTNTKSYIVLDIDAGTSSYLHLVSDKIDFLQSVEDRYSGEIVLSESLELNSIKKMVEDSESTVLALFFKKLEERLGFSMWERFKSRTIDFNLIKNNSEYSKFEGNISQLEERYNQVKVELRKGYEELQEKFKLAIISQNEYADSVKVIKEFVSILLREQYSKFFVDLVLDKSLNMEVGGSCAEWYPYFNTTDESKP